MFFIDFHRFCCDLVILGSYFDILGILGMWEKMCSVGFSLVFEFLFCWGILLSRVSFLFGAAQEKKQQTNEQSGGQRGWDLGFPALHRHHSGTGRKDTQNGKRCGKKPQFPS